MTAVDTEIIRLYYQISHQIGRIGTKLQEQNSYPNLYAGQYRCIHYLDKVGSVTQKDLAAHLEIRATSLSETLAKLEKKGYIERSPSAKDKRTYFISITPKGRECAQWVRQNGLVKTHGLIAPLNDSEKEQFYTILTKIKAYYMKSEEEVQ